jgi:hypothetical protein
MDGWMDASQVCALLLMMMGFAQVVYFVYHVTVRPNLSMTLMYGACWLLTAHLVVCMVWMDDASHVCGLLLMMMMMMMGLSCLGGLYVHHETVRTKFKHDDAVLPLL